MFSCKDLFTEKNPNVVVWLNYDSYDYNTSVKYVCPLQVMFHKPVD